MYYFAQKMGNRSWVLIGARSALAETLAQKDIPKTADDLRLCLNFLGGIPTEAVAENKNLPIDIPKYEVLKPTRGAYEPECFNWIRNSVEIVRENFAKSDSLPALALLVAARSYAYGAFQEEHDFADINQ